MTSNLLPHIEHYLNLSRDTEDENSSDFSPLELLFDDFFAVILFESNDLKRTETMSTRIGENSAISIIRDFGEKLPNLPPCLS